jgi:DNA repair protein RadC
MMTPATLPPADLRERMRLEGVSTLGDAELLALLLGGGPPGKSAFAVAGDVLNEAGGLAALARDGVDDELASRHGLGEAKRVRVEAALELGRRAVQRTAMSRSRVLSNAADVAEWAHATIGIGVHEEIWLIALDARHGARGIRRVATGGAQGCATSVRDILRIALRLGASGFVLVHNHPSGDPAPSGDDARMTREVARAASLLGIPLVDHVIVGGGTYASLLEMGLIDSGAPRAVRAKVSERWR